MMPILVLLGGVLFSAALLVACVLTLRMVRKSGRRRSPLHGKKLANLPGQQLMKRIADHNDEMLMAIAIMYFSIPLMIGTWALLHVQWSEFVFGIREAIFAAAGLGMFGYGFLMFYRYSKARISAEDGLIAEQMTGQLLNRLVGPECLVAHDLPADGFNIDHVVITPNAVYAVETKSFRKPRASDDDSHYKVCFDGQVLKFKEWTDTKSVQQARRQAQWLARYLRESLDRPIPVLPALAIPGWWIDKTEAGKKSDLKVFTPIGRGAQHLMTGKQVIDAPTRALVAQALAQKYPNVEE